MWRAVDVTGVFCSESIPIPQHSTCSGNRELSLQN